MVFRASQTRADARFLNYTSTNVGNFLNRPPCRTVRHFFP